MFHVSGEDDVDEQLMIGTLQPSTPFTGRCMEVKTSIRPIMQGWLKTD